MSTEEEIREYFTDDDWNKMTPAEKSHFLNFKVIMQRTNDNEIIYDGIECEATNSPQISDGTQEIKDDNNTVLTNAYLHCQDCKQKYTNFCLNCEMLSSILDNDVRVHVYDRIIRTLPKDILYITNKIDGQRAVITRIDIPCHIHFGPCEGLQIIHDRNEYLWRFEGDRLKSVDDSCTNWMIYVRHVKNASNANLTVMQCDSSLYFRTIRKINRGEELVVYFDEENFEFGQKLKLYYRPRLLTLSKNIYACTFCCLGFSSEKYLVNHKMICSYMTTEKKIHGEIVQCPFCKIYLNEREYMEFHMTCCCEKNSKKCLLPIADNEQQYKAVKPPPKQYSNKNMKRVRNESNLTQVPNMPLISNSIKQENATRLKRPSNQSDDRKLINPLTKLVINENFKRIMLRTDKKLNQSNIDGRIDSSITVLNKINESQLGMYNYEPINVRSFPCDYCNKWFTSSDFQQAHQREYHNKPNTSNRDLREDESANINEHRCNYCFKIFSFVNQLTYHIKNEHDTEQNVINPVSMFHNSTANIMKAATKTSEDVIESGNLTNENQVNADTDDESFLRKLNLAKAKNDKKMVNGLEVKVKKDSSRTLRKRKDIEGMYINALWEHDLKILKVENEKYFKCNYCPRSFKAFNHFKLHLCKEHNTTEYTRNNDMKWRKPNVQCRCCFKCFDSTIGRDIHEQSLHKQETSLKHNFRSRSEKEISKKGKIKVFDNNKRKGGGRRKYFKCNVCPRSFRQSSYFKLHLLKEHNTTDYVNNKDKISQDEQRKFKCRYCFERYNRLGPKLLHEKDCHKEEYISNQPDENIIHEIDSVDDLISESIKQEIVDLENEEDAQTIIHFINQLEANSKETRMHTNKFSVKKAIDDIIGVNMYNNEININTAEVIGKDERNVIDNCVNEDFDNGHIDLSDDDCQEYVKNSNFNYGNVGSSDLSDENCAENVKYSKFGNGDVGIFVLNEENCQENVNRSKSDYDNVGISDLSDDNCQEYIKISDSDNENVGSSDLSDENCEENVKYSKFGNGNVGIFVLNEENCQENVNRSKSDYDNVGISDLSDDNCQEYIKISDSDNENVGSSDLSDDNCQEYIKISDSDNENVGSSDLSDDNCQEYIKISDSDNENVGSSDLSDDNYQENVKISESDNENVGSSDLSDDNCQENVKNSKFSNGNGGIFVSSEENCQENVKISESDNENVGSSDLSDDNCQENVKNSKFANGNVGIFVSSDENCQENVKISENIDILDNQIDNRNIDDDLNVVNNGENTKIGSNIGAYGGNVGIEKRNTFVNDEEHHFSGENSDITLHDCRLCTKQFKTVKELETHIHVIPSERNRYECADCGYKTNNKLCLERHMINTHISKGFKTNNVESTRMLHTRRSEALFSCFICNVGYLRCDQLEQHLSETHKVDDNYYKCGECNYKTDRLAEFLEHHRQKHKKLRERRNATNDVNKLIRNVNNELYKCEVCYQEFRQKKTLKEHIRYKHFENGKKLQCPKCIFTTDYKRNLVRHLYKHEEIKPFNCEQCNKSFIRKEQYDLHALDHKKTSLYRCSDCDYGSNNIYCMKQHRRQVHYE